jgi:hypothetical protein
VVHASPGRGMIGPRSRRLVRAMHARGDASPRDAGGSSHAISVRTSSPYFLVLFFSTTGRRAQPCSDTPRDMGDEYGVPLERNTRHEQAHVQLIVEAHRWRGGRHRARPAHEPRANGDGAHLREARLWLPRGSAELFHARAGGRRITDRRLYLWLFMKPIAAMLLLVPILLPAIKVLGILVLYVVAAQRRQEGGGADGHRAAVHRADRARA